MEYVHIKQNNKSCKWEGGGDDEILLHVDSKFGF